MEAGIIHGIEAESAFCSRSKDKHAGAHGYIPYRYGENRNMANVPGYETQVAYSEFCVTFSAFDGIPTATAAAADTGTLFELSIFFFVCVCSIPAFELSMHASFKRSFFLPAQPRPGVGDR